MKVVHSLTIALVLASSAGIASADAFFERNNPFNAQSTLIRAEVKTQVAETPRTGRTVRSEFFQTNRVRITSTHPCAQVLAEAAEAHHLGLLMLGDHMPQPTDQQIEQTRLAGAQDLGSFLSTV